MLRRAACCLVLLGLCSRGRAGEAPDPLFWEAEEDFLEQVEAGELARRLELHLLQYAADPRWRAEWAALRHSGNGLMGQWGSRTSDDLFVDARIALNVFPLERLQFRFDRYDYQDGRFDVSDQRLDAVWFVAPAFALVFSGWPSADKELASIGGGVRVGAPRGRNALDLRLVRERFVWNAKSHGDVRFAAAPVRLLVQGAWEAGRWRAHGTVDYGLEYEAAQRGADGADARSTRGFQRFADVEAGYGAGAWTGTARLTGAFLSRRQRERAGGAFALERAWGRATLAVRRDVGRWTASAQVGWASQRDELSSPGVPGATYALDALLGGIEGGVRVARGLELHLGYLASSERAERIVAGPSGLPGVEADAYYDKAHVRAVYTFGPAMAIELLLSQALRGGRFGGGSVKAVLAL